MPYWLTNPWILMGAGALILFWKINLLAIIGGAVLIGIGAFIWKNEQKQDQ